MNGAVDKRIGQVHRWRPAHRGPQQLSPPSATPRRGRQGVAQRRIEIIRVQTANIIGPKYYRIERCHPSSLIIKHLYRHSHPPLPAPIPRLTSRYTECHPGVAYDAPIGMVRLVQPTDGIYMREPMPKVRWGMEAGSYVA